MDQTLELSFSTLDISIIVVFLLVVLGAGFFGGGKKPESEENYLLGARRLSLPWFVLTLTCSWYGGILGVGEFSYSYGLSNWFTQGLPYYVWAILFACLFAAKIRQSGQITLADHLGKTYGLQVGRLAALLSALLSNPAPYILMNGLLLQMMFGGALWVWLCVGTVLSVIYLFKGGFLSDVRTDLVEGVFMFAGFFLLCGVLYRQYGGINFLQSNVPDTLQTWHGGNSWQYVVVWFFIALWTFVDPAFHQRCAAARSPRVAKQGIMLSVLLWILFDAMTTSTGLYARAILPDLSQPALAYPLLSELVLPSGFKGIFWAGLLATVMSTLNTFVFVASSTLGKDFLGSFSSWRARKDVFQSTRIAIFWVCGIGLLLSVFVQSVVDLWYVLGTVVVPGLFVPTVTSYFPRLRMSSSTALASMVSGFFVASCWLAGSWLQFGSEQGVYWWNTQPMFVGLIVSALVALLGRIRQA